jgi:hypothetical protein
MFVTRDEEKKNLCIEKGVSLVCIPYWYVHNLNIVLFFI